MLRMWFMGVLEISLGFRKAVSFLVPGSMYCYGEEFLIKLLRRAVYASFTCILAIGGAAVGTIVGAIKGQTTETGFLGGSMIGAVAGAITAVQLLESVADDESLLSRVALLVSPASQKAYQWQMMMAFESASREILDLYDADGARGLSRNCIKSLPEHKFHFCHETESGCSICLQELMEGEDARLLQRCGHVFHLVCIDEWLIRQGTCPICRQRVCDETRT